MRALVKNIQVRRNYHSTERCYWHKVTPDTGLVTLLLRTSVPSLEIWDSRDKCYVKAEALCGEDELLAFVGEKIPMFTNSKHFPATLHRVVRCLNLNTSDMQLMVS